MLKEARKRVKPGSTWMHFKGGIYKVIDIGFHTETEELMVIYCPISDNRNVFVRPISMWTPDRFLETHSDL